MQELDATQQELEDLRMTLRRADSENKAKAVEIEQVGEIMAVIVVGAGSELCLYLFKPWF